MLSRRIGLVSNRMRKDNTIIRRVCGFQRRTIWFSSEQTNWKQRKEQKIDWRNPGERLDHIPDHVVYALPPQEPPAIYSTKEKRWRQFRSRLPGVVVSLVILVSLLYKALNSKRSVRVWLELYAPHLRDLMENLGILEQFPQAEGLSRPALFRRIWLQFADSGEGILVKEAIDIVKCLTRNVGGNLATDHLFDTLRQVTDRETAADEDLTELRLDAPTFIAFLEMSLSRTQITDNILYMNSMDTLGICAISPKAEASLCSLYDFLVERQSTTAFSVKDLTEVSQDLGVGFQEDAARQFVTDSRAVQLGEIGLKEDDFLMKKDGVILDKQALQRQKQQPVDPENAQWLIKSDITVPIRRHEWVNFWAYVMRKYGAEQIQRYVDVYIMLQSVKQS